MRSLESQLEGMLDDELWEREERGEADKDDKDAKDNDDGDGDDVRGDAVAYRVPWE